MSGNRMAYCSVIMIWKRRLLSYSNLIMCWWIYYLLSFILCISHGSIKWFQLLKLEIRQIQFLYQHSTWWHYDNPRFIRPMIFKTDKYTWNNSFAALLNYFERRGTNEQVSRWVPSVFVAKFFSNPFSSTSRVLTMQPALLTYSILLLF